MKKQTHEELVAEFKAMAKEHKKAMELVLKRGWTRKEESIDINFLEFAGANGLKIIKGFEKQLDKDDYFGK